ncbi:MAG: dihydropteroate synthase [Gammaproteobacteria bacterium]|nr:MAG: dihydropteroate synthase [Gammaproteobacteria bacterium]
MMKKTLTAGRFALDLSRPQIMGILNVTPDSFSDGGRFIDVYSALHHVEDMLNAGADIIDIGAESTRPGAALVDEATELKRLLPVIDAINTRFDCCLSIDTNKPAVMREVLARQVSMINDVRGFVAEGALETVADSDAALCIMHMQGLPENMQQQPSYHDVVNEVKHFLCTQADKALAAGIAKDRIVIDPGFGFGKTAEQNMLLLKHADLLASEYPLLFGLSRKSTLGVILGDAVADRTVASVTGALLAIQNGASIVRVHDVKATADAIKVYQAMLN